MLGTKKLAGHGIKVGRLVMPFLFKSKLLKINVGVRVRYFLETFQLV